MTRRRVSHGCRMGMGFREQCVQWARGEGVPSSLVGNMLTHTTALSLTQHALSTAEKQRSEKQKSKKPGNSRLRAARRQGRTMLHQLSSQFVRRDRGEMKINRVRSCRTLSFAQCLPSWGCGELAVQQLS